MKVSFDFDNTLSRGSVQKYAKELVERGTDVYVCTSRFEDTTRYIGLVQGDISHDDLFSVVDAVGIPREKILFTNMEEKAETIREYRFLWHLDDDFHELHVINSTTDTRGISAIGSNWKSKCEKLLKKQQLTQ